MLVVMGGILLQLQAAPAFPRKANSPRGLRLMVTVYPLTEIRNQPTRCMKFFLNASCRYNGIRPANEAMVMKTPRTLFLCTAALLMLFSCRDDSFLPLAEAQAFSASADISAVEANARLDDHLRRIGKLPRLGKYAFSRCYVRRGEYYFLNAMVKSGPLDGYAVNATTGQVRRVNDIPRKLLPRYTFDEQNTALFPTGN